MCTVTDLGPWQKVMYMLDADLQQAIATFEFPMLIHVHICKISDGVAYACSVTLFVRISSLCQNLYWHDAVVLALHAGWRVGCRCSVCRDQGVIHLQVCTDWYLRVLCCTCMPCFLPCADNACTRTLATLKNRNACVTMIIRP